MNRALVVQITAVQSSNRCGDRHYNKLFTTPLNSSLYKSYLWPTLYGIAFLLLGSRFPTNSRLDKAFNECKHKPLSAVFVTDNGPSKSLANNKQKVNQKMPRIMGLISLSTSHKHRRAK